MNGPPRPPITTCFGGGGAFGYGFNMGVADGLIEGGIDVRRHPMIGTSAGAHAAASLGAGLTFEHVADLWETYIESQTRRWWVRARELSEPIYLGESADDVASVAVRLLTLRRVVFHSETISLVDLTAASSSVLPVVRPHRIDGKRYIDGGHRSLASADLTPGADLLLQILPFSHPAQGIAGRLGSRQARKEAARWTRTHGAPVMRISPTAEMAAFGGKRLNELGDMTIGRLVYPAAVELGLEVAGTIERDARSSVEAPSSAPPGR